MPQGSHEHHEPWGTSAFGLRPRYHVPMSLWTILIIVVVVLLLVALLGHGRY